MLQKKINILHLEDESMDAYLAKKILERAKLNFDITVIETKQSFIDHISSKRYDLVIADHSLPQFTAMDALHYMKDNKIDVPFILVTGTVSEDFAVGAMKEGAWDYILKDRLQRLPIAVTSVMERYYSQLERNNYIEELIAKESLMKEAERLASFGSWQANYTDQKMTWSDEMYRMLGYETGAVAPEFKNFLARVHPEDEQHVRKINEHALQYQKHLQFECRILTTNKTLKHIYAEVSIKRNNKNEPVKVNGYIRDITDNVMAKIKLKESEKKNQYLFENSPWASWVIDCETHRFLDVNNFAMQYYGYSYEEFTKLNAKDIRPENEQNKYEKSLTTNDKHTIVQSLWKHIKKDGTVVTVEEMNGNILFEGKPAKLVLIKHIDTQSETK
jgi:PAS domain S-box-containing protein